MHGTSDEKAEKPRPTGELESTLLAIWQRNLERPDLDVNDDFFEAGGQSLLAIRLVHDIEQSIGLRVPVAALFEAPTVRRLAQLLRADWHLREGSSLVAIRRGGSRPPLIVAHGVASNSLSYRPLIELLGNDQPIYGIEGQGLDGRSIEDTSVEQMAARYADDIVAALPEGPCVLAGFCYGGLVAYEVAQQLQRHGKHVALLALFDSYHPSANRREDQAIRQRAWRLLSGSTDGPPLTLSLLGRLLERIPRHARYRMRQLARKVRLAVCTAMLRVGQRVPRRWRSEYVQSSYQRIIGAYRPSPYSGRTALFRSAMSPGNANDLGWDGWLKNPEVYDIPGDHFMIRSDARFALAQNLEQAIAAAVQASQRSSVEAHASAV